MLLKNKTEHSETISQVEFEKVSDDLLMISIDNDVDDSSKVFSYWRLLGTGVNPPLEIGINNGKKTIKNITFFVDSDCFKDLYFQELNALKGSISVDTNIFKKENDYVDITGEYLVFVSDNRLMCVFDSNSHIKEIIGNNSVKFLINSNDELYGFIIYNIKEEEIKKIMSIHNI